MLDKKRKKELEESAKRIRNLIVDMIYNAKSGHPGGSLSCVELLTLLYLEVMDLSLDENNQRIDKFVLSKGHAAPAYYAALSLAGFIPQEELLTLRKINSHIEGHPSNKISGVDISSGSLGQGLSIANGMGLAKKVSNQEGYVYCLLGDGEIEEGQFYEALMTTNKYNLNNVIFFIDNNGLQIDGKVDEVMPHGDLKKKIEGFGISVTKIKGHDFDQIFDAINEAKRNNKPSCIILDTIKGKGISFMENQVSWHGKSLSDEEYKIAKEELKGEI